ncbi:MAG: fibrobacter succinogenes major paralogous domain-containing protein [Rikenellaceae bacterium]|nr:fibrobacter succinogenes major paralogous domain-containing protein [Rikenellaceae bacterium]
MEFPAVGGRNPDSSGALYDAGTWGYYWSSVTYTSNTRNAYYLWFDSSDLNVYYDNRRYGRSVRCVR